MKKYIAIALVLVLTMCLFAGCRGSQNDAASESTGNTNFTENNMLPDGGDTIDPTNGQDTVDPTNGANRETGSSEATENTAAGDPTPTNGTGDDGRSRSRVFPRH